MLKDRRTWTTLAYLILMLPLGIVYFAVAVVGLSARRPYWWRGRRLSDLEDQCLC